MRIGNRLWGSVLCSIAVLAYVPWSLAANLADKVVTVPLGGSLSSQSGDHHYGVYIPTRFGGELTIKASSGTVGTITGPDGRERRNGQEVGQNQQGWYTF